MDRDTAGNIVLGGWTSDSTMKTLYNTPDPIMLFIQLGNQYLWGISFTGVNFDRVSIVKFNPTGSLIFAGFEQAILANVFTFSVVNSTNGNLINSFRVSSSNAYGKFFRMNQMLVDSSNNLYIALYQFSN